MKGAAIFARAASLIVLVSACQPTDERSSALTAAPETDQAVATPGASTSETAATKEGAGPQTRFAGIAAEQTIRFTGTEPFWGGSVSGGEMVYSTPGNQNGDTIAVRRFAGNNGLGFNGTWNGAQLDMTVTPGACLDGMSDRTYPFTVTLKLGAEQRSGCAWTDRNPFTGPPNP